MSVLYIIELDHSSISESSEDSLLSSVISSPHCVSFQALQEVDVLTFTQKRKELEKKYQDKFSELNVSSLSEEQIDTLIKDSVYSDLRSNYYFVGSGGKKSGINIL